MLRVREPLPLFRQPYFDGALRILQVAGLGLPIKGPIRDLGIPITGPIRDLIRVPKKKGSYNIKVPRRDVIRVPIKGSIR